METHIDELLKKIIKRGYVMRNPYKPGAGTAPEFLAGRDKILNDATNILNELKDGGMAEHTIYFGVRGVGKTVLLNRIEEMAMNLGCLCTHIECDDGLDFIKTIIISCRSFIKQLSLCSVIKEKIDMAKAVLMSFKGTYSPNDNSFSFELKEDVMARYGNADTGELTMDLITLFTTLGELADKTETPICFFVDEIQALERKQLMSFISALHRMNQLSLPFLLVGAGLPTIRRIASDAKSYAERMFAYMEITSLKTVDAISALIEPAKIYNVEYSKDAIDYILSETGCYPYFIQQYGKLLWKTVSNNKIITKTDAEIIREEYRETLNNGFFGSRYNRATNKEKEFLYAMVECGRFPCSMTDVAIKMNKNVKSISPLRSHLLNKGLIYSPSFGEVDFTVPHFDKFLNREKFGA